VVKGEVSMVTDDGQEILRAGDAAGFKGGDSNGHCLRNHTGGISLVLEIGSRIETDAAHYPDIDMVAPPRGEPAIYTHRDGTPYPDIKRRDSE